MLMPSPSYSPSKAITHLVRGLLFTIQPNDLDDAHLQKLVHARDLVEHLQDIFDCFGHRALREEDERVALARRVGLGSEEGLNELRRVGDEMLELAIDRVHGKDGVLADIRVPVLEARAADRNEGLQKLSVLGDLLEEPKGCTPDILIGVLLQAGAIRWGHGIKDGRTNKVITDGVASQIVRMQHLGAVAADSHNKNHLLLQFPDVVILWAHLPVEMQELLELFVS